jgi:tetratricopeptide (TPR) repeat protein
VALLETPCSREAIEAVLGGQAVHDTLSDLKEHYLLNTAGAAEAREYFLHSMLQGYFGRLLSYEAPKMHSRAGKYYRRQHHALRAAQHFLKAGQPKQAARLATEEVWSSVNRGKAEALHDLLEQLAPVEMDNFLKARVAIARGDVGNFLRRSSEAGSNYQLVLDTLPAEGSSSEARELRARACLGLGDLRQHDSLMAALAWLERGLQELANDDSSIRAELLIKIGTVSMALGKHQVALQAVQQSLDLLPKTANTLRMRALITEGAIYSSQGNVALGHLHTLEALRIAEDLHDHFRLLSILSNSGLENGILGQWKDAEADFLRALGIAQQIGSLTEEAKLANNLGVLYTDMGRLDEALPYLARAQELAKNLDLHDFLPFVLTSLGDLCIRREDWRAAEEALAGAEEAAQRPGTDYPLAEAYFLRSHVLRATGHTREAIVLAQRAVDLAHELDLTQEEGKAWRALGQALLADGQTGKAGEAFQSSLDFLAGQNAYEAARTKVQWALALLHAADRAAVQRGLAMLHEASAVFAECGAERDLASVDRILNAS